MNKLTSFTVISKTPSKTQLRTTDWRPGIKHGLGIKRGLETMQTMYMKAALER